MCVWGGCAFEHVFICKLPVLTGPIAFLVTDSDPIPLVSSPPSQVVESKDEAVKGQLYEEAGLL